MTERTSENCPIRVDLIPADVVGLPDSSGSLGMTLAPGVKDWNWNRDMKTDMQHLGDHWETHILVSLIEEQEYELYEMDGYADEARAADIEVEEWPIRDVDIPREDQVEEYADLVGKVIGFLREGRNTVVHCRGGKGRTGTLVCCVLVGLGDEANEAIRVASRARGTRVPDTEEQKEYIREFARRHRGRWSR